jgi:hypothetical protein
MLTIPAIFASVAGISSGAGGMIQGKEPIVANQERDE